MLDSEISCIYKSRTSTFNGVFYYSHDVIVFTSFGYCIVGDNANNEQNVLMLLSLLKYRADTQSLLIYIGYRSSDREKRWPLEMRHLMTSFSIGWT